MCYACGPMDNHFITSQQQDETVYSGKPVPKSVTPYFLITYVFLTGEERWTSTLTLLFLFIINLKCQSIPHISLSLPQFSGVAGYSVTDGRERQGSGQEERLLSVAVVVSLGREACIVEESVRVSFVASPSMQQRSREYEGISWSAADLKKKNKKINKIFISLSECSRSAFKKFPHSPSRP